MVSPLSINLGKFGSSKLGFLVPALGVLVGCADRGADYSVFEEAGTDDGPDGGTCVATGGPFTITKVSPAQGSTLTLTFSEPVGELVNVDPSDFRISVGTTTWSEEYGQVYQSSQYLDLVIYEETYPYVLFKSVALTPGTDPCKVELELDRAIPAFACEYIEYFNGIAPNYAGMFEKTMLLHHAGGPIPIHSSDDVTLGDIGAWWVHSPYWNDYVPEAGFPNLGTRVDIPCP